MTYPHGGADEIWRDGEGVVHNPRKGQIRDWGARVEQELDAAGEGLAVVQVLASANRSELENLQSTTARFAPLYADTVAGLAATSDGDYFNVPSDDPLVSVALYLNEAGSAVLIKESPSAKALGEVSRINYFVGSPTNKAATVETGFIAKADGSEGSSSGWRRTGFIDVDADTILISWAAPVPSGSSACNFAFYDQAQEYLGFYNMAASDQVVKVGDVFPTAAFVRAADPSASGFNLTVEKRLLPIAWMGWRI